MTAPLVRHICTCGYHLVRNPDAEQKWNLSNKGFAQIFHPCANCLRSQVENMIEAIEEGTLAYDATGGFFETIGTVIAIIKKNAGIK